MRHDFELIKVKNPLKKKQPPFRTDQKPNILHKLVSLTHCLIRIYLNRLGLTEENYNWKVNPLTLKFVWFLFDPFDFEVATWKYLHINCFYDFKQMSGDSQKSQSKFLFYQNFYIHFVCPVNPENSTQLCERYWPKWLLKIFIRTLPVS